MFVSAYYIPGIRPGNGDSALNKTDRISVEQLMGHAEYGLAKGSTVQGMLLKGGYTCSRNTK